MSFFELSHKFSIPSTESFQLHSHNNYEIVYFFQGDVDYVVEGAVYPLSPHDMILVRPFEMHRAFHKTNKLYERTVINIERSFFEKYNCEAYADIFNRRSGGTKNIIYSSSVKKSGIDDCFKRLSEYTNDFSNTNTPVSAAVLTEILYLLNDIDASGSPTVNRVQQVISYINSHFTENITLSSLAARFFISGAHLARIFKSATGYTVSEYVNIKRLTNAVLLYKSGVSWGSAADSCGFKDYASFYRAFCRRFSCSPRDYFENASR